MANKGLQFEKCIMYLAMSTGYLKEREYNTKVGEFLSDWQTSPNEIKIASSNAMKGIFNECSATTFDQKKALCKTFQKMSSKNIEELIELIKSIFLYIWCFFS